MIPTVIRNLRAKQFNTFDIDMLRERYGYDLWHLIVDDSKRSPMKEMNPALNVILGALQTSSNTDENTDPINNAIDRDSGLGTNRRRRRMSVNNQINERLAKLRFKKDLTPADRLMKVVRILIRESLPLGNDRRGSASRNTRRHTRRIHKKQLHQRISPNVAAMQMQMLQMQPNVVLNSMRRKRSVSFGSNENDAVAMNVLQSMIKSNEDKTDKDDAFADDADDYDDRTYQKSNKNRKSKSQSKGKDGKKRTEPTDQKKQTQQLKQEQQAKQAEFMKDDDYKDYAFDTTDTDHFDEDEELLRSFYGQRRSSAFDDYGEYGSFSDLMHLAAKHTLRNQREDKYMSRLHNEDYLNDEEEEYVDMDEDYIS